MHYIVLQITFVINLVFLLEKNLYQTTFLSNYTFVISDLKIKNMFYLIQMNFLIKKMIEIQIKM